MATSATILKIYFVLLILNSKASWLKTCRSKQEAYGPWLTHLSEIATADMQMLCSIFPVLPLQIMKGSSLEQFLVLKMNLFFTIYGYSSQWSVTIWTNSQSCFISRIDTGSWREGAGEDNSCRIKFWLLFKAFATSVRMQAFVKLSSTSSKYRNDGRRGISIACCHSYLCYTSNISLQGQTRAELNLVFFPCWCTTGSVFSANVQQGLLYLLVLHRVFFPCWCLINVLLKAFLWQSNKMATGHKTHILGRHHQMIITAK